jgi:TfoX/Sxy family transcriptional regulator of competence genes
MPDRPTFAKSPPELVARFGAVLDRVGTPAVTRRPMFGYPCAWVNGNMASGLYADQWWVRLPPHRLEAALASGEGRPFEVMPGRGMKGYVSMSDDILADDATLDAWVGEAIEHTATLPPKSK